MGLRDRAKAASSAAIEAGAKSGRRVREKLDTRGVDVDGAGAADGARRTPRTARESVTWARDTAAARGIDVRGFSGAAVEGLGVTNGRGHVKLWRVARAALRPTKTGSAVATNLAREAFKQRRALAGTTEVHTSHGLDEHYFGDLLEWIIADAGVRDDDQNRAHLALFLGFSGVDHIAQEALAPSMLETYFLRVEEEPLNLATRTAWLLGAAPGAEELLVQRLDELREHAVAHPRDGRFQLLRSVCCGGAVDIDVVVGVARCQRCGEGC